MAEPVPTTVIGPLLSMVMETASSDLLEQYNVMEGMKKQHNLLKRRLQAILDVITDAEKQAAEHKEGTKAWLDSVQNVAYQASDIFDKFNYEALRRKAKKEGHYRELGMHIIKLFPTHNRILFRYKMGKKLRMILQAIEVLVVEMNTFQLKVRSPQQLSMNWRQTDSNVLDPMEIASRSRAIDMHRVIDILLGQGSRVDLTVLPIVGMGGLGKTTLAQLVYSHSKIREHFQLLRWVCVADNFDVDFLAKCILETASKTDGKPPLDSLREALSGKRYLLILDDVWNRDAGKWETLKSSLQHGGMGSSVLMTTRDEAIAQFMGTIETYNLDPLDKSFIEEIIKTRAFSSMVASPADELVEMVSDMANKCAGNPLVATALGSALRTMSTTYDEKRGISPELILRYNNLPPQMKQCFSFCAIFPKDYDIDVEMLIRLWIANGFILEEHGVCPEIRGLKL